MNFKCNEWIIEKKRYCEKKVKREDGYCPTHTGKTHNYEHI